MQSLDGDWDEPRYGLCWDCVEAGQQLGSWSKVLEGLWGNWVEIMEGKGKGMVGEKLRILVKFF